MRRLLDAVRRQIRTYVWVEGLAILIALFGGAFWIGLLLDWTFEPSPRWRQVGFVVLGIGALFVAYWYLLRRVAVPISDSTIASLLERRFPALAEHVQTSVDVASSPERGDTFHPDFLDQTHQSAAHAVAHIQPGALFNRGPLVRSITTAIVLVVSIALFALVSRDAFAFWIERLALSNEPWPRRVHLEVVGFPSNDSGERVHKLAQDDDFELLVHAPAGEYEVPDEVEIRFRLADGRRGRDTMIRVGEAAAGVSDPDTKNEAIQLFRYQFKRVAADMVFDVVGGDDRVRDLRLQVVERPELFAIELECNYPDYLGRLPRRLPMTGGMRIPEGTEIVLHAASTKPLAAARIHRTGEQQDEHFKFTAGVPLDELRWNYGRLEEDDVLLVSVTDSDGVSTREPYRISLAAVPDEVPQVAVRLAGIGSAVTPDATLPLVGKITDDYGLDRAWFEFRLEGSPPAQRPLTTQPRGEPLINKVDEFDLRATDETTGKRALELKPGERFTLTLKASDRFDLSDEPREGSSQPFALDVVTPGDLLKLLEDHELALRQRYEAIYEKMIDTRDVLGRVEFGDAAEDSAGEEALGSEDEISDNRSASSSSLSTSSQRALARRRLRVAGSLQNVVQSADEVAGVAEGFDDLGEQLTNNRIDNPDLKSRLREQIAQPLHRIADERMPELVAELELLDEQVADAAAGPAQLAKATELADKILIEMRQVLDRMLELETYNEVVTLLRDIITDQEELSRRTKERQKERLRSLFEEE